MDSITDVIALVFVITMVAIFFLVHYVRLRLGQLRERSPMVGHGRRRAAYGSNSGKYSDSGYYSGSESYSGSGSSDSSGGCDSGSSSCD